MCSMQGFGDRQLPGFVHEQDEETMRVLRTVYQAAICDYNKLNK